jgi:hypothetical protein
LAQIIEAVLAGVMSSATALIQTQTLEAAASRDRLRADAWHELSHFEADQIFESGMPSTQTSSDGSWSCM